MSQSVCAQYTVNILYNRRPGQCLPIGRNGRRHFGSGYRFTGCFTFTYTIFFFVEVWERPGRNYRKRGSAGKMERVTLHLKTYLCREGVVVESTPRRSFRVLICLKMFSIIKFCR